MAYMMFYRERPLRFTDITVGGQQRKRTKASKPLTIPWDQNKKLPGARRVRRREVRPAASVPHTVETIN